MVCHTLLSGQLFNHDFEVGPGSTILLGTLENFKKVKSRFDGVAVFTEVYLASWIKYKGTRYRPGMTLWISHSVDGEPEFGTIQKMVLLNSKVQLIVKRWDTTGFERHLFAFTVSPTSEIDAVDINSIADYHPLHIVRSHKENDNDHYISLRYRLF